MADGYHIEKLAKFWQYIGRLTRNLEGDEESNADIGHVTKTAISQIQDGGRQPF